MLLRVSLGEEKVVSLLTNSDQRIIAHKVSEKYSKNYRETSFFSKAAKKIEKADKISTTQEKIEGSKSSETLTFVKSEPKSSLA